MATALTSQQLAETAVPARQTKRKSRRRKTAHLKLVPGTRQQREQMRAKCAEVAARLDKTTPLTKDDMETISRATLDEMGLPDGYVGWMMVVLATECWRDQVAAVPPQRRLFLSAWPFRFSMI